MTHLPIAEANRRAYLDSLGIVQYQAREVIPGARPGVLCDVAPAPVVAANAKTAAKSVDDVIAPQMPSARQSIPKAAPKQPQAEILENAESHEHAEPQPATASISLAAVTSAAAPVVTKSQSQRPAANTASNIAFCFLWLPIHNGLSLLVEAADADIGDLNAQEHRLLADILKALGWQQGRADYAFFRWPLVNNPQISQGLHEARDSLISYLEQQQIGGRLLLLGQLPAKVLVDQGSQVAIGDATLQLVEVPSLQTMLQNWQAKATAWRLMLPLLSPQV